MNHIKLYEEFVNELKGVKNQISLGPWSKHDDDLYGGIVSKSKNKDFKRVVDKILQGMSVNQALLSLKVDRGNFYRTITKDEKTFLYHVSNINNDPNYQFGDDEDDDQEIKNAA